MKKACNSLKFFFSGLLKEQINVLEHPPGCSMNISKNNNTEEDALICFDNPIFISFNSTVSFCELIFNTLILKKECF